MRVGAYKFVTPSRPMARPEEINPDKKDALAIRPQHDMQPVNDVVDVEFVEVSPVDAGTDVAEVNHDFVPPEIPSQYVDMQSNGLRQYQNLTSYNQMAHFNRSNNLQKYQDSDTVYSHERLNKYKRQLLA
jgi:hypothetical protein